MVDEMKLTVSRLYVSHGSMRRTGLVLASLAFAGLFVFASGVADAQSKSVTVNRRDGDITIATDGTVQIVETWEVSFEGGPFRFAFRDFDMTRIEDITDVSVAEGAQTFSQASTQAPNTFNLAPSPGHFKITWYFDDTTNRVRTFTLRYTLHGVIRQYPGGDQFWWQFIEGDRGYVILNSHVVQHLPAPVPADQLRVESYPGTPAIVDERTVTFDGDSFASYATFILRTQFPHGIITAAAPSWQAADDAARQQLEQEQAQRAQQEAQAKAEAQARTDLQNFQQLAGGVIVLVGGLLGALVFYFLRVRPMPVALPAEYLNAPPDELAPGPAGALVDGHADDTHLVATLVDMARRGILKMTARGDDHTFQRLNLPKGTKVRSFEQTILDTIFRGKSKRSLASPGDIAVIRQYKDAVERAMAQELVKAGYFQAVGTTGNVASKISSQLIGVLVILAAAGIMFVALGVMSGSISPATIFLGIAVLVVPGVFWFLLTRKNNLTRQGAQAAAKWRAFKRYLQNVQQYTEVKQAQDQFEKYLPFAVAFGVTGDWIHAFEETATPAPEWYHMPDVSTHKASHETTQSHGAFVSFDTPHTSSGGSGGTSVNPPSLNQMADDSFRSLNSMSAGFMSMLSGAASALSMPEPSHTRSSSSSSSASSSSSDWSSSSSSSDWGSSSSSSDSWSGGGSSDSGGSSGGGSSGFG